MRKTTVFDLCETHSSLGGGRRTAEIVCEGGPACAGPCSPQLCRILPGTDFYSDRCTDEEFANLVAKWEVNAK